MTHEEELLLREYLRLDGDAFDDWLHETRDGTIDGEREYKASLAQARAWQRGFQEGRAHGFREGARACAAWTEAEEDSALAAEALSQNPRAGEGADAKLGGRAARPRRCRPAR